MYVPEYDKSKLNQFHFYFEVNLSTLEKIEEINFDSSLSTTRTNSKEKEHTKNTKNLYWNTMSYLLIIQIADNGTNACQDLVNKWHCFADLNSNKVSFTFLSDFYKRITGHVLDTLVSFCLKKEKRGKRMSELIIKNKLKKAYKF